MLPKMAVSALCVLVLASLPGAAAQADVRSRIREGTCCFKDVSLTSRVTRVDLRELRKIGSDFARGYEIKSTTIRYKSPDKMRADGAIGLLKMSMIISGDRKGFRFPIRGWVKRNIKDAPHQRQTDLDLGIITESLWRDYIVLDAKTEDDSGKATFRITFAWSNSRNKKHVCWVDVGTLKLVKRQRFEKDGSVIATYIYSEHKRVGDIWVPRRIDVYSGGGKLAGTTVCESIRVNTGIPDSEFEFR